MSTKVVVWTPGDARVWWACPVCKVEAGISPPVDMEEFMRRISLFRDEHAACAHKVKTEQQGVITWRG